MNAHADQRSPERRLEIGLPFAFGCLALGTILWLAFRSDSLNDQQFEILRIVLALAGSLVAGSEPSFPDFSTSR